MRTATITAALAATIIALVAGCSSGTGTTPPGATATTTATASTGRTLPAAGAPKVTNPLDTTKYQQNPCSVLTPAQRQALGNNSPDKPSQGASGPTCQWLDPSTSSSLTVTFFTRTYVRIGLTGPYQNKSGFQLFQPTQVNGYPAVIGSRTGHGQDGRCAVYVGTADDMLVEFYVSLSSGTPGYADACSIAQNEAIAGMTTMKAGS